MPDGAQAWKIIKPPGSSTDRIAQACDRCRSKKIRCDGLRPCCSQCKTVGVECRLSDKLTRRAFPRGYTESLEDRVRQLESENAKLMSLLDIKDEQMEMMSKMNIKQSPSFLSVSPPIRKLSPDKDNDEEDTRYSVKHSDKLTPMLTYRGASAGGVFIDALIEKFREKAPMAVDPVKRLAEAVEKENQCPSLSAFGDFPSPLSMVSETNGPGIPSRVICDKLVTVYFQEWHSMYPIEDERKFLELYQKYQEEEPVDNRDLFAVRLQLVLSLALLVNKDTTKEYETLSWKLSRDWKRTFTYNMQTSCSIDTVRTLALACLFSLHTGNVEDIWHYRTALVNLIHRLGLYRTQEGLKTIYGQELSSKDKEERRRLFWNAYVLDTFVSAFLGCPRLFHDVDIECEFPASQQDSECSLAIIKLSKILADILTAIYSITSHSHSYKEIVILEDKLEIWKRELPSSLRFDFVNGQPAAKLSPVHQKAPILLMIHNYAKTLIHLPALSASSDDLSQPCRSSGANVAVMQNVKTYLDVFNYLRARNVVSTMPLNPSRLAFFFSTVVLYGGLGYSKGGALFKDVRTLIGSTLKSLRNELKTRRPGGISSECYQWLQQVCDIVLCFPSKKHSSSATRKSVDQSEPREIRPAMPLLSPESIGGDIGMACFPQRQTPMARPAVKVKTEPREMRPPVINPLPSPGDAGDLLDSDSVLNNDHPFQRVDAEIKALDDLICINHDYSRRASEARLASEEQQVSEEQRANEKKRSTTSPMSDRCVEPANLFNKYLDWWNFDEYNIAEHVGDSATSAESSVSPKQEEDLASKILTSIPIPTIYGLGEVDWTGL